MRSLIVSFLLISLSTGLCFGEENLPSHLSDADFNRAMEQYLEATADRFTMPSDQGMLLEARQFSQSMGESSPYKPLFDRLQRVQETLTTTGPDSREAVQAEEEKLRRQIISSFQRDSRYILMQQIRDQLQEQSNPTPPQAVNDCEEANQTGERYCNDTGITYVPKCSADDPNCTIADRMNAALVSEDESTREPAGSDPDNQYRGTSSEGQ